MHTDAEHSVSNASTPLLRKPLSNAKVESYFGEMKRFTLSEMRQRPAAFLRQIMTNIKGRLNDRRLPTPTNCKRSSTNAGHLPRKKVKKSQEVLTSIPERWHRSKAARGRRSKYINSSYGANVMKNVNVFAQAGTGDPASSKLVRTKVNPTEISSDSLDQLLTLLRACYPQLNKNKH